MKILQVITSLKTGGAEKLIVDMVPMYRQRGYDVDVLLFDGTGTPFKKLLKAKGVNIFELGCGGSVYNPIYILKLLPYFHKYDIIHTHNTAPQLFAAIASLVSSVVLCTTEHTTSNRRRSLKWYRPIDKWMYSRYKKIISISPATTENLRKHIKKSCPIDTIPNGINVERYSAAISVERKNIGCKNDAFLLMMVAGFRYQKDQDTIIRALTLLPKNVQLCLVGDGDRRDECEELVKRLNLGERVVFTGVRSDIPNVLKAADVVIMSSHLEGFGLAAVEGMAAGKPVVASDVVGLGDIVKNYGCVFPQGDERKLAEIVDRLRNDSNLYKALAGQCYSRSKDYDISKTIDSYIDIYESIVK